MNDSIYGRNRIKVRSVSSDKYYKKYICKSSFLSQKIKNLSYKKSNKNFVAIHGIKPVSTLD